VGKRLANAGVAEKRSDGRYVLLVDVSKKRLKAARS
jgi:hypothetical protein